MKRMKKLASFVLAMVMVLSMSMSAFAYDIEIAETEKSGFTDEHEYNVYQIFTGNLADDGSLTDIKYGANYHPYVNVGDEVPQNVLSEFDVAGAYYNNADAFAKAIIDELNGDAVATLDSTNSWKATGLVAGYYLIVDDTDQEITEGDAFSGYIVQVVDNVTMAPKSDKIKPDKVIQADNYDPDGDDATTDDTIAADGKANNVGIGSTVTFELKVTLPKNADDYSYYYCVLNDTLSEGLTFDANSVTVYVSDDDELNTTGDKLLAQETDYKLYDNTNSATTDDVDEGLTFQVAMLKAKYLAGKTVFVTYDAVLNENAKIGVEGNPNTFDVTYSNDPTSDYDDENNNGKPDDDTTLPTGTTTKIITRTYSTGLKIYKVDEEENALDGAEFEITGTSIKKVLVTGYEYVLSTEDGDSVDNETYYLLNTGSYTTTSPQLVDEYVEKTAEEGRDGGYVKEGESYVVANDEQLADETITLYKLVQANGSSYADTTNTYKLIAVNKVVEDAADVNVKAYVDEKGILKFVGLGEGTYTIKETKVPDGYNKIDDITVVVDWTAPGSTTTDCTWSVTATIDDDPETLQTDDADTNLYKLTIENVKGSNLPETGGMGTTIFYIVGSIMVLAAVVILVTRKRMSNEE